MIDIIIPVYNSDSLVEALASVAIQRIKDRVKVYLIDDCSTMDYSKVLSLFEDKLNISYFKLDKNMGPGYARQFGIDNSNGEYIVFMDSDDQLYNCYSLEILYDSIHENNFDVVLGYYYMEDENGCFLADESYMGGCLHGKIYRRSHLVKNNIRFNNSRYSEDNSFNTLALATASNSTIINNIVYVYKNNVNSITKDKNKFLFIHSSYLHNMLWVVTELEKRKTGEDVILNILPFAYSFIFRLVRDNPRRDFSKLYLCCAKFESKYKQFEKVIPKDYVNKYIGEANLVEFEEFRKNFRSR